MSLARRHAAALLFAALAPATLVACKTDNPNFCQGADCPVDAAIDAPVVVGCDDNADLCTDDETCLANVCVDCEDGDDTQSAQCTTAAAPVCTAAHTCRACADDNECDSLVCDAGTCLAAADVIYVAPNGTDNPNCTQAMKCKTVAKAVMVANATRKNIRLGAGTYTADAAVAVDGKDIVIYGNGATMDRSNNNEILTLNNGATVEARRLTISGASGANGQGIKCEGASTIKLRSSTVTLSTQNGISGSNCSLDLRNSTIFDNQKVGIDIPSGGSLTLINSNVSGNDDGGVNFRGERFVVVGNYVVQNGDQQSPPHGGLDLFASMATGNRLEFNTVASNQSAATVVGGINCAAVGLISRNNIVWGNIGLAGPQQTGCTPQFSCLQGAAVPGTGNTNVDPMFTAAGAGIEMFHLKATSPLKAAADPATAFDAFNDHDFDGTARPTPAGAADIGADEIP